MKNKFCFRLPTSQLITQDQLQKKKKKHVSSNSLLKKKPIKPSDNLKSFCLSVDELYSVYLIEKE